MLCGPKAFALQCMRCLQRQGCASTRIPTKHAFRCQSYAFKRDAQVAHRPLLDALGEGYDAHADGTGFYALQSCANHSCQPNAHTLKSDGDSTGDAVVTATAAIPAGTEITISYIDTELPLRERQAALADYGFTCRCGRCLREGAGAGGGSGGTGSRKRPAADGDVVQ